MTKLINKIFFFVLLLVSVLSLPAIAQDIALDHPVRCGSLQCFPLVGKENEFLYLPSNPHVVFRENGKPELSFLRYVESSTAASSDGSGGVIEASGGGILHFLVDYTVSPAKRAAAEQELRDINEDAVLRGPIIFESGTFALVSSVAPEEGKENELSRHVIGVGRAPLIEGLKAAVSIHLTKLGAQILWRSFQMETPDVSLVFEMTFSGLSDPAEATITADWSKLIKQADVSFGGDVGYMGIGVGFDYGNFWQDAKNTGAISIDYKGDPDKLQAIVDRAYAKLHDVMFEPIPAESANSESDDTLGGIMDAVNAASRNSGYSFPWQLKLNGGYKRRKINRTGKYVFDFRQRSRVSITTAMAGNIGGLYKDWGEDPAIFRTVNLSDPEYRVREISVALDARDSNEFSKYINHVTFSMQKQHDSGASSSGELTINRNNYTSGRPQVLSYGWDGDASIEQWMGYQYKADWSFVGGAQHSSGWLDSSNASVALTPPYQYRKVEFIADPTILQQENVRMVSIRVRHDFFGREVKDTINLIPSRNQFAAIKEFAVPPGNDELEYIITWTMHDRRKLTSGVLRSEDSVIFCDELPVTE